MTSHAHAAAYEQHAPEQYAQQGFSQPLASASHEDQPSRALELREPPRAAYADYQENDVTADLSAPPIVPAYSSENLAQPCVVVEFRLRYAGAAADAAEADVHGADAD